MPCCFDQFKSFSLSSTTLSTLKQDIFTYLSASVPFGSVHIVERWVCCCCCDGCGGGGGGGGGCPSSSSSSSSSSCLVRLGLVWFAGLAADRA